MAKLILISIRVFLFALALGGSDSVVAAGFGWSSDAVEICIRGDGSTYKPHCAQRSGGPKMCDCGRDMRALEAYCHPGEWPAPSTAQANRARYAAAANGSLEHAQYQGRRFCIHYKPENKLPYDMDNGVSSIPQQPCCGGASS